MPALFGRRSVVILATGMTAQGLLILFDHVVTAGAGWNVLRPFTVPLGVMLIILGVGVAVEEWHPRRRVIAPWGALGATAFLAVFFLANACQYKGAGLSAALWWVMFGMLMFETVVLVQRRAS